MLGRCRHHNAVLAYLISSELGLEIRGLTGHKINDQKEIEADAHIKIEVKLGDNDSVVLDATAAQNATRKIIKMILIQKNFVRNRPTSKGNHSHNNTKCARK